MLSELVGLPKEIEHMTVGVFSAAFFCDDCNWHLGENIKLLWCLRLGDFQIHVVVVLAQLIDGGDLPLLDRASNLEHALFVELF